MRGGELPAGRRFPRQDFDGVRKLEIRDLVAGRRPDDVLPLRRNCLLRYEVMRQVGLARSFQFHEIGCLIAVGHGDVGHDTGRLYRTTRRRVIARSREVQGAVCPTIQGNDRLYGPFSERGHADDGGPLVILQGAGNDFRSGSRAAIDQNDERLAVRYVSRLRVVSFRVLGPAAACRDNFAALQKIIGNSNRLIENAAAIVAQIDDVALQSRTDLFAKGLHRGDDPLVRFLVEGGNPDVTDIYFAVIFYRLHLDRRANQGNFEGLLPTRPEQGEVHLRSRGPAKKILHLVEVQTLQPLSVYGENAITGLYSGMRGRRVVDRRHHIDAAILGRNDEAHASVGARRLHLHFGKGLRIEIAGMRIEIRNHPVERILDHFPVVGLIRIIGAYRGEGRAETIQRLISRLRIRVGCAARNRKKNQTAGKFGCQAQRQQRRAPNFAAFGSVWSDRHCRGPIPARSVRRRGFRRGRGGFAVQQIQRIGELEVFDFLAGGRTDHRRFFFRAALPFQMSWKIRFGNVVKLRRVLIVVAFCHGYVGNDSAGLNRAPGGRVVSRGREAQGAAAAAKRDDCLYRTLSERRHSFNRRPFVVLKSTGNDLRRRRCTGIDQHDDRLAVGDVAGLRIIAGRVFRMATARGHDLSRIQEIV